MTTQLWIDDIRTPVDDTIQVVRTYDAAIQALENSTYTDIYLDHDLACYSDSGREMTGYDVVVWIVNQHINNPSFVAPTRYHLLTSNPVGRKNMTDVIEHWLPGKIIR